MTFIVPTMYKPLNGAAEYKVWMVNNDNHNESGWTQFFIQCPECEANNVFRFFENIDYKEKDGFSYENFECKCPECRHIWEIEEKEEIE